jgi:hypothetical protein
MITTMTLCTLFLALALLHEMRQALVEFCVWVPSVVPIDTSTSVHLL